MLTIFIIDEFIVFFLISLFDYDKRTFDNKIFSSNEYEIDCQKNYNLLLIFYDVFQKMSKKFEINLKKHFTSKFIIKKIV